MSHLGYGTFALLKAQLEQALQGDLGWLAQGTGQKICVRKGICSRAEVYSKLRN